MIPDTSKKLDEEENTEQKMNSDSSSIETKKTDAKESGITIEEKRERERVNKQDKQTSKKRKDARFSKLDIVSILFYILNIVLCFVIVYYIEHYFSITYSLVFVIVMAFILCMCCLSMHKKKKLGMILNIILCGFLGVACIGVFKVAGFTNKILNNSETETVAIIVKKDAKIDIDTPFEGKNYAVIDMDRENNSFAEELLEEHHKVGYEKVVFSDYETAYQALMEEKVDFMGYSAYAQLRLQEAEIDLSNYRVLFEKVRDLEAVEAERVDIAKDPFTMLISGVDLTSNNINEKGNSDVNILLSVNPAKKLTSLQVIPRDLWAELPCTQCSTKLTYAGTWGGIDCSIKAIEQYFDIKVNYYTKINFEGVVDLVDSLGGIEVNSHYNFCSGTTCFQTGMNYVNGEQALRFARERKVLPEGDVSRGKHQMEIISGVVNKFMQDASLNHLNNLMNTLGNNFTTNLSSKDISKAVMLFSELSPTFNLEMNSIQGELKWNDDSCTFEYLYYFYPNEGETKAVKDRIDKVIHEK